MQGEEVELGGGNLLQFESLEGGGHAPCFCSMSPEEKVRAGEKKSIISKTATSWK